jgi:hypothetical protein
MMQPLNSSKRHIIKNTHMIKKYCLIVTFLAVTPLFAQKSHQRLAAFTTLDVFGPFEIELIKAESPSIDINYGGIDKDDIVVDVHHDVLKLKFKNKHFMNEWKSSSYDHRHDDYVKVKVYYTDIDAIEAEAGAKVFSRAPLKSKNLIIDTSMGAEIELDLIAKNVLVKSSMGAITELSGKSEQLEIKASMGSEILAGRLQSKVAFVRATMGSVVRVNVLEELDASAGFGATIDYSGGPAVRHKNTSLGAEIRSRH